MLHNRLRQYPEIFSLLQPSRKIGQIFSSVIGQAKWLDANQVINFAKMFKLLVALTHIEKILHCHNIYLLWNLYGPFYIYNFWVNLSWFPRFSRNCKSKWRFWKAYTSTWRHHTIRRPNFDVLFIFKYYRIHIRDGKSSETGNSSQDGKLVKCESGVWRVSCLNLFV